MIESHIVQEGETLTKIAQTYENTTAKLQQKNRMQNTRIVAGQKLSLKKRVQKGSVVLHGEMDALENAGRQKASIYQESVLYTTLSPCPMCSGTILLYGIPKVVIGENKTFMGEEELLKSRGVEVIIVNDDECISIMAQFIKDKPELWHEDIGI